MSLAAACQQPLSAPCLLGSWTSTGLSGLSGQGPATFGGGGAGVRLHLDRAGHLTIVFSGMGSVNGSGSGISSTPLNGGAWQCEGNTMTLAEHPSSELTGLWTFTRTGHA